MARHEWFFLPPSRDYAALWVIGPLLALVLSAVAPGGRSDQCATPRGLFTVMVSITTIALMNALLLWGHMRGQFLIWTTGWKPLIGNYLVMTALCIAAGGVVMILRGLGRPALHGIDVLFTAESVSTALSALSAALAVGAIWKTEEPGVSSIRMQRQVALPLLRRFPNIETDELRLLSDVAKSIVTAADSVQLQLTRDADRKLAAAWRTAADELHTILKGKKPTDFKALPDRVSDVRKQFTILDRGPA